MSNILSQTHSFYIFAQILLKLLSCSFAQRWLTICPSKKCLSHSHISYSFFSQPFLFAELHCRSLDFEWKYLMSITSFSLHQARSNMTDVSITTHFPSEGNQNQNKIRTALQIISMINLGAYSVILDYNKSMPFLFYKNMMDVIVTFSSLMVDKNQTKSRTTQNFQN